VGEHPLGEEDRSRETAENTLLREPGQLRAALPFRRQFQSVVACGNIRYEEDLIAGTLVRMKAFAGLLSQDCPFYPRNLPQTLFNSEQSPNMPSLQVSKGAVGRIMYQIPLSCGPSVRPPLVPSAGRVPSARVHRAGTASPERHNRAPRDFRGG